jgi:hypothetical protein
MVTRVLIMLALATLSAQTPTRELQRPRSGTSSIAGIVTRADGPKAPLRRARVTVSGSTLTAPRIDTTDDSGRFDIGGLPAGEYSVSASKPAYLAMNFGATRPKRQGTSVVLGDGQRVTNIAIALPRGAAIAGTVTNAAGEPLSNVYVNLLHRALYNGERRLLPAPTSGLTNDRGEYRAYGLAAGDYLVVAQVLVFSEPGDSPEVLPLAAADIDRVLQEARLGNRTIAASPAVSTTTRSPRPGVAPIFHPGTANGALAATVTVLPGEERTGIDIRLDLVPMARIDGTVTSPDGRALAPGMQVVLTPLGPSAPWEEYGGAGRLAPQTPDSEGRFAFAGVPPGDYSVMTRPRPQAPGRGGVPPPPSTASTSRIAYATVAVNGDDQNVTLTLQPGISIAGRFAFDGTGAPTSMPGARLMLEDLRVDPNGGLRTYSAEAGSDVAFQIRDILPGRFKISNEMRPGLLPGSGWALTSVMSGGRDLLDAPFELQMGAGLSDVVVTFTDHPSELTGTLQGATGTPTSDYFIVAFSTDRQFWFPNSRRITSVRPNTSGAYAIRNLPSGEYFISALTDVEDGEWFDPDFLQTLLRASPLKIAIGEGEKSVQNLRIGR